MPEERKSVVRRIAREIIQLLKKVSKPVEVEVGLKFEPIPTPVVKLYAKIRALRLLLQEEGENGDREKGDERSSSHDEGASKRDPTQDAV